MGFYHSWFYKYILNTTWFIWGVVIIIVVANILGPLILWFVINGKPLWNKNLIPNRNKKDNK